MDDTEKALSFPSDNKDDSPEVSEAPKASIFPPGCTKTFCIRADRPRASAIAFTPIVLIRFSRKSINLSAFVSAKIDAIARAPSSPILLRRSWISSIVTLFLRVEAIA
ncbi:hypothetical protein ACHAXM_010452 [Skeletonema potamos]